MKAAIIVWNIFTILYSVLFATGKMTDMGWLVYMMANTLICTVIADKSGEKKVANK